MMAFARGLLIGALLLFVALGSHGMAKGHRPVILGNWLFVGDSHSVGAFGDGLRSKLLGSNQILDLNFYQFSVAGSSVTQWLNGNFHDLTSDYAFKLPGKTKVAGSGKTPSRFRSLGALVGAVHPHNVIIALGTNDSARFANAYLREEHQGSQTPGGSTLRALTEDARRLMGALPDSARCFWVLPPRIKTRNIPEAQHQLYTEALLKQVEASDCTPLDSRLVRNLPSDLPIGPITPDYRDGIHFKKIKGEHWGRTIAEQLLRLLSE